jgi:hypothetical protein
MKKVFFIMILILMTGISFTFCKSQEQKKTKDESISGQTNDVNSLSKVEPQVITTQVNQKLLKQEEIQKKYNPHPIPEILPEWAMKIGITLPEGLLFLPNLSKITSIDSSVNKYNSLTFIYVGPYETAMKQAELIASKANVSLNPDFKRALDNNKKQREEALKAGNNNNIQEIKGAIYANYITTEDQKTLKYIISINVDDKGTLIISIADQKQLNSFYPNK